MRRFGSWVLLLVVGFVASMSLVGIGAGIAGAEDEEELVWKIAFGSARDGNYDIYVMNADGSNQTNLTSNNSGYDGQPSWSPDGSQIAFRSKRDENSEIYVMDATDGSNQKNVTNNPGRDESPSWSPVMLPAPEPSTPLAMATAVMTLCGMMKRRERMIHQ